MPANGQSTFPKSDSFTKTTFRTADLSAAAALTFTLLRANRPAASGPKLAFAASRAARTARKPVPAKRPASTFQWALQQGLQQTIQQALSSRLYPGSIQQTLQQALQQALQVKPRKVADFLCFFPCTSSFFAANNDCRMRTCSGSRTCSFIASGLHFLLPTHLDLDDARGCERR